MEDLVDVCDIVQVSVKLAFMALKLHFKYRTSYCDSLILAAALEADCQILYSEDMQHGQVIENTLKIVNPFVE